MSNRFWLVAALWCLDKINFRKVDDRGYHTNIVAQLQQLQETNQG